MMPTRRQHVGDLDRHHDRRRHDLDRHDADKHSLLAWPPDPATLIVDLR